MERSEEGLGTHLRGEGEVVGGGGAGPFLIGAMVLISYLMMSVTAFLSAVKKARSSCANVLARVRWSASTDLCACDHASARAFWYGRFPSRCGRPGGREDSPAFPGTRGRACDR